MDRQRGSRNLEDDDDEHLDGVVLLMLTSLVCSLRCLEFHSPARVQAAMICFVCLSSILDVEHRSPVSLMSHTWPQPVRGVCVCVCSGVQMRGEEDVQRRSRPQEHKNRQRHLAGTHIRTGHPVGTHSCGGLGKTASHHSRTLRQAEGPVRSVPHLRACLGAVTSHSNPLQTVFPGVA